MRMRKIGVFWVKLVAFLCLLVMMCNTVGMLVCSGVDTTQNALALKHLPRNSVDVLWMGSSHVFCGVIPQMLYDEYGITSAMFGMQGLSINQMYWGLKEILRSQSPAVVVMDLYTATPPYSYGGIINMVWARDSEFLCPNTYAYNLLGEIARWIPFGSPHKCPAIREAKQRYNIIPTEVVELTKLHERYCDLNRSDFLVANAQDSFSLDFGAMFHSTIVNPDRIERADYRQGGIVESDQLWQFTEEQLAEVSLQPDIRQDIERIIQLTRERGIELIFCVVPYIVNEAEEKIYQQLAQLARDECVGFAGADEVQIGYDQLHDMGHLNMEGALRYTAFWGGELSRRFDLPDRRQSTDRRYAAWRDHTGRYLAQIAARRKYGTMSEYLEMLTELDEDFLVLLGFQGAVYDRFTEDDYWLLVEELGVPEDVLAQWYDTGEGTLNVLIHNKQSLASNYDQNEQGGVELRWNVFGTPVSIKGGKHEVNQKRTLNSSQDGLHITVFSLSNSRSVNQISFDLTQVEE